MVATFWVMSLVGIHPGRASITIHASPKTNISDSNMQRQLTVFPKLFRIYIYFDLALTKELYFFLRGTRNTWLFAAMISDFNDLE